MKGMKSTDVPSDDELEKSMIPFDKLRNMSSRAAKKLWAAPFSSMNISNARDEFWAGTEKGLLRWDSTKDMWIVADGPNEGYAFFAPADVIDMFGDAPLKALRARGANSYVTRYRWDDGKLSLHPEDGSGVDEVLIWDDRGKKWV